MKQGTINKAVRAVPEGFHTITPFLVVDNATRLIEFLKNAFDGKLIFLQKEEDNKIMHATVKIGNSIIMIGDTMKGMGQQTAMLYLYVDDADAMYKKAVNAGGQSFLEPTTEFYGDRAGAIKDEWGNLWWMATHVEDVSDEEIDRRTQKMIEERKNKSSEVPA